MTVRVRCPSEPCSSVFELPRWRMGRNVYCPDCGTRMTARPAGLDAQLRDREKTIRGGRGRPVRRLPLIALVDNVRSLWNVGSIFRSADACGVRELILTGITGCPPRDEITKTALGAEEAVAWSYAADTAQALARVRERGYTPVALETAPGAVALTDMRWPERTCLVLGNEVAGVSREALGDCGSRVYIPMRGMKESLNVAVAFGIAVFHVSDALSRREGGQLEDDARSSGTSDVAGNGWTP